MTNLPRDLRARLDALGAPVTEANPAAAAFLRILENLCAQGIAPVTTEEALFHAARLVEERGLPWSQALYETTVHVLASQGWQRRK